jgi:hypothetical protein
MEQWKCSTQLGNAEGMELNCFFPGRTKSQRFQYGALSNCSDAPQMTAVMALLRQQLKQSAGNHNSTRRDLRVRCYGETTWLQLIGFETHRNKRGLIS